MTTAKILADSIDPRGNRLTTFVVTFPRIILAEFNTHRMFSRNSASSRAIPFEKMVESVKTNPFIPIAWQKDHKGMQGSEYLYETSSDVAKMEWLFARDNAIKAAKILSIESGITKQLCNRLLEPFMWHTVIITSSSEGLENFFKLRCPDYRPASDLSYRSKKDCWDAMGPQWDLCPPQNNIDWLNLNKGQSEIHMMQLSEIMYDLYNESIPKKLKEGEYHLPFCDNIDVDIEKLAKIEPKKSWDSTLIKISIARCARVSYTTFGEDKEHDYEADIKLYNRLLQSGHMSPFEHCARVMTDDEYYSFIKGNVSNEYLDVVSDDYSIIETGVFSSSFGWCYNLKGFISQRYLIENNVY